MSRPKAPELRQGHANRARRQLAVLPTASADAPELPPHAAKGLGRVGQATWKRLWAACGGAWQPAIDGLVVQMYCELLDRRAGFREAIKRDGWTSRGYNGRWRGC
jgi:hypothetical protein